MNKFCCYGFRFASTLGVISTLTLQVSAQEAGTNVSTPPPTQTPTALTGQDAPMEVPAAAGASSGSSNEPVIDAATSRQTFPNRPLLITGLVLFGGSYAASAIVAATSEREADEKLYYPVAGPWMDLAHRGCDVNPCANNTMDRALLVADGIVQGAGALSIVLSMVIPEKTTRHWYLIGNNDVVVAPQFGSSTLGLGAAGRF